MVDETTGRADASNGNTLPGTPGQPEGALQRSQVSAPSQLPQNPTPVQAQPAAGGDIQNDIAKILKDVKLPERRETEIAGERTAAPAPTKDIDALLSGETGGSAPTPVPTAPSASAPEQPAKDVVQSVHTLKQDLQNVVQDQKISVVKAAALEQDKVRPVEFAPPRRSNRTKNYIFAAGLLLFLGAAALGGVYIAVQGKTAPLPQQQDSSLVFAEQTVSLALGGQSPAQLKGLLAEARNASNASLGSITRIVPIVTTSTDAGESTRAATLSEFLSAIGARPPEELMRALSQDFFFGLHTVDKNAPLIVIPVTSYDRAFAGMLQWESTINADLAPIFVRVPDLKLGEDGIPANRTFSDVVMRNYDARALQDDSGAVALYYSFPSRNMLVIAESPYTFTELLSRLQAQRKL